MTRKLLVIGNGFDLAHGMKTRYHDFRDWLDRHHKAYVAKMEDGLNCHGDMLWANLEENTRLLKKIDYREKFHRHSSYLTEYSSKVIDQQGELVESYADDHGIGKVMADLMRDLFNQQGFQHYLEEELFWLYQLKGRFCMWLKSIKLAPKPIYSIPQNALYLNFNYTNLLEATYKIDPKNILHIHGGIDSEIEFGNPDLTSFSHTSEDARALEAKDEINRALKSVHKDVMSIINKTQFFFKNLNKIQTIYILGHSMNEIDEPYFFKLKESMPLNTHWTASYYNENDKLRAKELIFNRLGIHRFEIKTLDNIMENA